MPTHHGEGLERLTLSQLSRLTGAAKETVAKRLRAAGVAPVGQDGRSLYFEPRLALPVIYRVGEGLSLESERARLAREQADGQALRNAVARGELLEAADVRATWSSVVLTIKERMRGLPSRAVVAIPGFRKAQAKRLAELVDEVLSELAHGELTGAEGRKP